tara:strand:+ start:2555 stop:2788 length:234 start_codon:yes stop_codon:yes gene_type:complete
MHVERERNTMNSSQRTELETLFAALRAARLEVETGTLGRAILEARDVEQDERDLEWSETEPEPENVEIEGFLGLVLT